ncbi:MAG: hypothetical protein JO210_07625 [Acidobacteriaceae bacterium]|nr:hypothetical protein [Acidobacteriaceae bacterium]
MTDVANWDDPKIPKTITNGNHLYAKDIADVIFYLTEVCNITGEVLQVDDGAQVVRW